MNILVFAVSSVFSPPIHALLVDGRNGVPLSKVLQFFSGAAEIPFLGFECTPVLTFDENEKLPTASTCALQLTLPMHSTIQSVFEEQMVYGMLNHGGFGRV